MKILDLFTQKCSPNRGIKKPYIIAEAGVNHEGNIDIAKRLINETAEGGADAIKFQTHIADAESTHPNVKVRYRIDNPKYSDWIRLDPITHRK